jgi:hypothetical protein
MQFLVLVRRRRWRLDCSRMIIRSIDSNLCYTTQAAMRMLLLWQRSGILSLVVI